MDFDLEKPYCYYFNEIAKIPHGSKNEKALSEYIVAFAIANNLRYKQDELYNVIIYQDASPGYEEAPALIIQAHTDMVCEKSYGVEHDFEKDPIKLEVKDGFLQAQGTTLGADDGYGVAYMLALLSDQELKHPALECVFTSQEEIGLIGAKALKAEDLSGRSLISLDGGGETRTMISSAGGCRVEVSKELVYVNNDLATYQLVIHGLSGGHSGMEISNEKGNANKLTARILNEVKQQGWQVNLVSFNGGSKDNAIPIDCTVVFCSDCEKENLQQLITKSATAIAEELKWSDQGFVWDLSSCDKAPKCWQKEVNDALLDFLYLVPNGFKARSMAIAGLTLTSLNLGVCRSDDQYFKACFALRSVFTSAVNDLVGQIKALASLFKAELIIDSAYPGWDYNPQSALRDKLASLIEELYPDKKLELLAAHGGSEVGVFAELLPGIDIVLVGPISENAHTPQERLDLASFERFYLLLSKLVSSCD